MKKNFSIVTLIACMISFSSMAFGQVAPNKGKPIAKDNLPKLVKMHKMCEHVARMPHQVKNTFSFFKFADELELTDDQIIKLRAFYKKHFSEEAKKAEIAIKPPVPKELCEMSEMELVKFADDEAARRRKELMFKLQRIIDIKKILTPEQIEKLKKIVEKESEANKKRNESFKNSQKPVVKQHRDGSKKIAFKNPGKYEFHKKHFEPNDRKFSHMNPMCQPQGMCPQMPPMMPMMNPMCPPRGMGQQMPPMMPMMNPMCQPQGMCQQMPPMMPMMNPMCQPQGMCPQMPPMMPMMNPMCQPQGMCPQMPPMMPMMNPMCPPQGMGYQMPPMMPYNPMFHQNWMNKPDMNFGEKPFGKDFHKKPGFNKGDMPKPAFQGNFPPKKRPPFLGFLMKFFDCQNSCGSDMIKNKKGEKIIK